VIGRVCLLVAGSFVRATCSDLTKSKSLIFMKFSTDVQHLCQMSLTFSVAIGYGACWVLSQCSHHKRQYPTHSLNQQNTQIYVYNAPNQVRRPRYSGRISLWGAFGPQLHLGEV